MKTLYLTSTLLSMIWTLGDAAYPSAFLQLSDPPLMLYVQGQAQPLSGAALLMSWPGCLST